MCVYIRIYIRQYKLFYKIFACVFFPLVYGTRLLSRFRLFLWRLVSSLPSVKSLTTPKSIRSIRWSLTTKHVTTLSRKGRESRHGLGTSPGTGLDHTLGKRTEVRVGGLEPSGARTGLGGEDTVNDGHDKQSRVLYLGRRVLYPKTEFREQ